MAKKKKNLVEIHSTEPEYDNYMKAFAPSMEDMFNMSEYLKDWEESSIWYTLTLANLITSVESGGRLLVEDLKSRYHLADGTTEEAIASTIENGVQLNTVAGSQMLITTKEVDERFNTAFMLSDTGLSSLILRAGADCSAVGKASITDKKTVIDIGIKYAGDKTVLALYSNGKIRTFNGGNTYSILKQSEMFDAIVKMLNKDYKKFAFKGGSFTHTRTKASFELTGDTSEILKAYEKACEEISSLKSKGLKVQYDFSTSEVGEECATISVALARGELKILLGSPVKIPHNGDATTADFINELPMLLAKTKDLVTGLENLINIEIKNPINCMIYIAKNAGLAKTQTMAAVSDFQKVMDDTLAANSKAKFSAHDVFYVLQEALMEMRKASVASSTIEKCEENISKVLLKEYNWAEHDVAVRPEWSQK